MTAILLRVAMAKYNCVSKMVKAIIYMCTNFGAFIKRMHWYGVALENKCDTYSDTAVQ